MSIWPRWLSRSRKLAVEPAGSAQIPEELFAAQCEAAFRKSHNVQAVARKQGEFALLITHDGVVTTAYLGNLFNDLRDADPDQRATRIARFVGTLEQQQAGKSSSWAESKNKLVPVLRGLSSFSNVPAKARPVYRSFAPFLVEALAIDQPDSIAYVTRSNLTEWGVDVETAFNTARANGANFFADEDVEPYDNRAPYPLWHVAKDDDYQASRLLIPGWLASFQGKVTGRPVAVVPQRSLLVVGSDGDAACIARLIDAGRREFAASARRISPHLYTVDETGRVIPFVVPASHAIANDIARSRAMLADFEYGQQKAAIESALGESVFVASFIARQYPDGSIQSHAVWTRGVSTLLPRTDRIAFNCEPDEKAPLDYFLVEWDAAIRLCPAGLSLASEYDPPRWKTGEWPDDATLQALRSAAS